MNEILSQIRAQVGTESLSGSCSRDGCRVYMTGVPSPRIVVDVDRASQVHEISGKRCDFILFFTSATRDLLVMVPMELKSGGINASTASEQLQRGAVLAEQLQRDAELAVQLQRDAELAERFTRNRIAVGSVCHPILFHGKGIHKKARQALNRAKVRFRGRQLTIKTARCGHPGNLANVLAGEINR